MCLFCQIVQRKIPAKVVLENEFALAFLDIKPVKPGHCLVIPKKHYANLEEINLEELVAVIKIVKEVGRRIKANLGVKGYNLNLNNDPVAGQEINHLHWHLIPRHPADGLKLWPSAEYLPGEAEAILEKLKK